jgi:ketosteroid isomerase-like protein
MGAEFRLKGEPAELGPRLEEDADSIEPRDVIALDKDGRADNEPRKVRSLHQAETTVHMEFEDTDPGASFAFDEILWVSWPRPARVPDGCTGAAGEGEEAIAHDGPTCPVHESAEEEEAHADLHAQIGDAADCEQTAHRDDMPEPAVKDDSRCPGCGSDNIVTQTATDDHPPWACLNCDMEFEEPDTTARTPQPFEPAYTVVGTYDEGGPPYTVVVYTHNGPETAMRLAHEAYSEQVSAHSGELDPPELHIVAIFAGEPRLIDFDVPSTWPKTA